MEFSFAGIVLTADDYWIMAASSLCALACALAGTFLMLRKMALLGDAISHAVLPGIALAFYFTHSRAAFGVMIGAFISALITAYLVECVCRIGKVPQDASLGIVFSTFFALGVLAITWVARDVHLDPGCVLYGLLEFVPFDTMTLFGREIPRSVVVLGTLCVLNLGFISLFFKELTITSFDPLLAKSLGFGGLLFQALFLGMVSVTIVGSFEAVGAILVVTLLIAPPATAYLFTDRLGLLIAIACLLGISSALLGYLGALYLNTSVAGMISVVSGGQFIAALICAPHYGILAKAKVRFLLALRIAEEDILGVLYREQERKVRIHSDTRHPFDRIARFLLTLRRQIAVDSAGDYKLCPAGEARARELIRAHRLWETFLEKNLDLPLDHLHAASHRAEHFISKDIQEELKSELPVKKDPHGSEIP